LISSLTTTNSPILHFPQLVPPTHPFYPLSLHDALPIYLVHTPIVESPVEFDVEHVYDSAPITSHDLSLDIVDFARQEVRPLTARSEEHTSELQSREKIVCRLLLEKKKNLVFYLQDTRQT